MGGQACIFYGAAESSRDVDLVLAVDPPNLDRLQAVLADLYAERIAVPPLEPHYLNRGHCVHFRCRAPGADGARLDVMSKLRGVDEFARLWERRTTAVGAGGETYELLSLPDLVAAKKTQRDRDWPMIRRLVEASYAGAQLEPTQAQVVF